MKYSLKGSSGIRPGDCRVTNDTLLVCYYQINGACPMLCWCTCSHLLCGLYAQHWEQNTWLK